MNQPDQASDAGQIHRAGRMQITLRDIFLVVTMSAIGLGVGKWVFGSGTYFESLNLPDMALLTGPAHFFVEGILAPIFSQTRGVIQSTGVIVTGIYYAIIACAFVATRSYKLLAVIAFLHYLHCCMMYSGVQ